MDAERSMRSGTERRSRNVEALQHVIDGNVATLPAGVQRVLLRNIGTEQRADLVLFLQQHRATLRDVCMEHCSAFVVGSDRALLKASQTSAARPSSPSLANEGLGAGGGLKSSVGAPTLRGLAQSQGQAELLHALAGLSALQAFSLDGVQLHDKLAMHLLEALQSCPLLSRVALRNTRCTKAISDDVRRFCQASFALEHLEIVEEDFTEAAFVWQLPFATGVMETTVGFYVQQNAALARPLAPNCKVALTGGALCLLVTHTTRQLLLTESPKGRRLQSLPPQVMSFSDTLLVLDISCNGLKTLPPDLGKLTRLVGLNLSCNQLTELPVQLALLGGLQELLLAHNELIELSDAVGFMRQLHTLVSGVLRLV
jgi:hypothetical protein